MPLEHICQEARINIMEFTVTISRWRNLIEKAISVNGGMKWTKLFRSTLTRMAKIRASFCHSLLTNEINTAASVNQIAIKIQVCCFFRQQHVKQNSLLTNELIHLFLEWQSMAREETTEPESTMKASPQAFLLDNPSIAYLTLRLFGVNPIFCILF